MKNEIWETFKEIVRWYDVVLLVAAFSIIGYSIYHTWYQNTPERLSDPVNWVLTTVLLVIYFFVFWFRRK